MIKNDIVCWIVTEGLIGTENQCIGVAQALGIVPNIMRIQLKQPWKMLSPYFGFEQTYTFAPQLSPPWPDFLITSGRKSIAASRYIKKKSNGKTKTLHIQDPRISSDYFDLVAVPQHDPTRGENVIVTMAAPNKITPELLKAAENEFTFLSEFPAPRIAVLIGGHSKAYQMTKDITLDLISKLSDLDGSLLITCSRRTGIENQKLIAQNLASDKNFIWDGNGKNPYLGFLAWADIILVTADSVSMLSESCTTGKPVYMIDLKGGSKRITSLHNQLIKHGSLRIFNSSLEPFPYKPLNDSKFIAEEVKKRLKLFTD